MDRQVVEISWSSLWRVLLFIILAIVLFLGRSVLLGLFLALVISSGLDFLVNFLEGHSVPRALGVILVFLFGALLLVVIAYRVIPFVIIDLNTLLSGVNRSAATHWLGSLTTLQSSASLTSFINRLSTQLFSGNVSPISTLSDLVGGFGLVISVLVSSFYLSLSRDGVDRFIRAVMPESFEESTLRIYHRSRRKIGYWFRTQILLSLVMGLSTWGALGILVVPHAFLIGLLAGIFELVPFVGPILSGGAAVLAAFSVSTTLAIYTLIVFLILHQIEANILVPLFMRRSIGLHPVIVITALLIGIEIGGFLGAVIAVPAAAVFQEVVEEWGAKKRRIPRPQPS